MVSPKTAVFLEVGILIFKMISTDFNKIMSKENSQNRITADKKVMLKEKMG